jgi:hypothetical protein
MAAISPNEELMWRQQKLPSEERPRQIRINSAMIGAIARHLIAWEWARALRKIAEPWEWQQELERRVFLGVRR